MGRSTPFECRLTTSAWLIALAAGLGLAADASAQTTQVFNVPDSQVLDSMIRNGSYASSNQNGPVLLTRWSSVPEWERRTIFSIDTSTLPAGAQVASAILTLTVKSGLGNANTTRPVTAYRLAAPFVETEATWLNRQANTPWTTPGGDLGESYTTVFVTNTVGAKINFDITALVQKTLNGDFGLRLTRVALVDVGGGGDVKESYREYHASEATTPANRPQLTVVYNTTDPPAGGGTIDVPAGANLQQALNAVTPGGTIRLAPGATYVGNFTLPAKNGDGDEDYITITTGGVSLPPAGTRIDPSYRPQLATIKSSNVMSALATVNGASYYRIVGVAFSANVDGGGDVIALGNSANTSLTQVAHHIELDRVLIAGDAAVGQKRGVAVNAAHVLIKNSDIRDIKAVGQDSQAIAGWNTPGPVTIRNNFLEAAGENIMFGGSQTNIPNLVPSDITIENNHLSKNTAWRGSSWTVKNLFELKSARRVLVRGNLMEYNWSAAQPGYAVVLTPRNTGGQNPWSVVEDVEFSGNVVRHSGSGFNLLGHDDAQQSGQLARILIKNNLFYDISSSAWGGGGTFAQIGGEPRDITIDHNTVIHTGNLITFYRGSYVNAYGVKVSAGTIVGFVFTNNMTKHNAYGIFGSGQAYGTGSLNYYAPGSVVRRNVLAGGPASRYPADNFFPTVAVFYASFVNMAANDYRLVTGSPYIGAGTDGLDIGCSFAQ
jgi:hypothetical protein